MDLAGEALIDSGDFEAPIGVKERVALGSYLA
jgi:hypothetical protein